MCNFSEKIYLKLLGNSVTFGEIDKSALWIVTSRNTFHSFMLYLKDGYTAQITKCKLRNWL